MTKRKQYPLPAPLSLRFRREWEAAGKPNNKFKTFLKRVDPKAKVCMEWESKAWAAFVCSDNSWGEWGIFDDDTGEIWVYGRTDAETFALGNWPTKKN